MMKGSAWDKNDLPFLPWCFMVNIASWAGVQQFIVQITLVPDPTCPLSHKPTHTGDKKTFFSVYLC